MKQMGRHYLELFSEAKAQRSRAVDVPALNTLSQQEERLPQINLSHLRLLTDDTGVLQHAKFTVPNRAHGYCVDDNARALIVATRAADLNRGDISLFGLSSIYLSFLDDAFDRLADFVILCLTSVNGWRPLDQKILTGAHCGRWA